MLDLYLSENEILIYNSIVGNSKTFLLSPNLQRNTEVHKTLTQICIYVGLFNCSGFGVADQRQQFVTFRFQITHLHVFFTTKVDSSHIIVQI